MKLIYKSFRYYMNWDNLIFQFLACIQRVRIHRHWLISFCASLLFISLCPMYAFVPTGCSTVLCMYECRPPITVGTCALFTWWLKGLYIVYGFQSVIASLAERSQGNVQHHNRYKIFRWMLFRRYFTSIFRFFSMKNFFNKWVKKSIKYLNSCAFA